MNQRALLLLLSIIILVACASAADPAATVEQYLQAKVNGDAETIRALLCSEMEAVWEREANSFQSVTGVQIEGMACARVGETDTVSCQGRIIALYGAEQTEFPLVSYRVVEEGGEWKWCGES
ncbi:MAG: hypothetical protein AB1791_21875 [Chloroflexota bacterium]